MLIPEKMPNVPKKVVDEFNTSMDEFEKQYYDEIMANAKANGHAKSVPSK